MINQTLDKLSSMKLRAMEQEYRRQVELPANAVLPFDERLAMIVDTEWLAKANNRLQRFLREHPHTLPKEALMLHRLILNSRTKGRDAVTLDKFFT